MRFRQLARDQGGRLEKRQEICGLFDPARGSKWQWFRYVKIVKSLRCFVIVVNSSCDGTIVVNDQLKTCGEVWWDSIFVLCYKTLFLY